MTTKTLYKKRVWLSNNILDRAFVCCSIDESKYGKTDPARYIYTDFAIGFEGNELLISSNDDDGANIKSILTSLHGFIGDFLVELTKTEIEPVQKDKLDTLKIPKVAAKKHKSKK